VSGIIVGIETAKVLHTGEAEAIVLSKQKNADWFLTDDEATRLFVSKLSIEVRGLLGVVL
jgi:predicted nucleic acid-binding protein